MTWAEVIALIVFKGCITMIGTVSNILAILAVVPTRQLRETWTVVLLTDVIICAALASTPTNEHRRHQLQLRINYLPKQKAEANN